MANYDSPGLLYDSGAQYDSVAAPSSAKNPMAKPKLNLAQLGLEEILTLANGIRTAMTSNANFTTPTPALTALGALITTAQTKLADYTAAQDTLNTKLSERDAAFGALAAGLTQLAGYVEAASGGDAAKIKSAGMDVRAQAVPLGVPGQVANLAVTAGDFEGTVDCGWDPQAPAKSYEVQTSADPMSGTSWAYKLTATRSTTTIEGLTSGSKIWVRVRAIGAAGVGPWSDPAVKTVP
jgi:hypothetical protein